MKIIEIKKSIKLLNVAVIDINGTTWHCPLNIWKFVDISFLFHITVLLIKKNKSICIINLKHTYYNYLDFILY